MKCPHCNKEIKEAMVVSSNEQVKIAQEYLKGLARQDKETWEKLLKENPFLEEWNEMMKR